MKYKRGMDGGMVMMKILIQINGWILRNNKYAISSILHMCKPK